MSTPTKLLCRVNSGGAQFASLLRLTEPHERSAASTRKKSVLVCYVRPVKWQTSLFDSASGYPGSFSTQGLPEQKLEQTALTSDLQRKPVVFCLKFWVFFFHVQKSGSHGWSCWLDTLSHPLSYITHLQTWHTLICSEVEGGCGEVCENCTWGAESWASTIR